jgi:hypothetical protein
VQRQKRPDDNHVISPRLVIRYILNVLNDSTWGLLLVYFMIKKSTAFVRRKRIKLLYSGQYGRPPQYKVRLVLSAFAGTWCAPRADASLQLQ